MPFQLVVVRGRSTVNHHRLAPGATTVAGRQEGCQLQIKSSQVSRKHCEFTERDGHLVVKDLKSSNGTFVNGERIQGERILKPGDELSIGGVKFRIEDLQEGTPIAAGPGETAVPVVATPESGSQVEAVAIVDDSIPLDDDTQTTVTAPTRDSSPAAPSRSEPEEESGESEIGEDAVAEFLMDLNVDDDDKL